MTVFVCRKQLVLFGSMMLLASTVWLPVRHDVVSCRAGDGGSDGDRRAADTCRLTADC